MLIVLLLIIVFPIIMITTNSFKTETEYYAGGPFALPQSLNLDSINAMWNKMDYTIKLWNSFFISVVTSLIAIGLSLFNAFALGIGKVKGRVFFLVFFLMAFMLPQEVLAFPLYYFFKLFGYSKHELTVTGISSVLFFV